MSGLPMSVDVTFEFLLDRPVVVERSHDGARVVGDTVQWRAYYNGPEAATKNFGTIVATLFGGGTNAEIAMSAIRPGRGEWLESDVPDWCPRPPADWDAHVRAFRAACDEAEVAS